MNSELRGSSGGAPLSVEEIADLVGGRVVGDGTRLVTGIRPVDETAPGEMAFLTSKRYVRFVERCEGAAYLVSTPMEHALPAEVPRVVVDQPHAALSVLLRHFHPAEGWVPSVHATAVIGRGARLGDGVQIGAYVVVEDEAVIGDSVRIGPHCVIGRRSRIGEGSCLYPHVVVYHDCEIGKRAIVHSGTCVGSDGFGFTFVDGEHAKIPQVGRCIVGDDVEIGANSALDRGSLGDTRVDSGVKIDNLVHIAHNVRIGARTLIAAMVGIAGSTRVGRGVWLGGRSSLINNISIGDQARVAVLSGVTNDVEGGATVSGYPARPHRAELRRQGWLGRLPKLAERLRRLEEAVGHPKTTR